jgi:integrase
MIPVNEAQAQALRRCVARSSGRVLWCFATTKVRGWKRVRKSLAAARRRAGITDFRCHDLRHTCASWLVMAGADLVSVQQQLGHITTGTTMRSAHLSPGHRKKSSNLISTRRGDGNISGTFGDFPVQEGRRGKGKKPANRWRKCMGIEPTYRLQQTAHRI